MPQVLRLPKHRREWESYPRLSHGSTQSVMSTGRAKPGTDQRPTPVFGFQIESGYNFYNVNQFQI